MFKGIDISNHNGSIDFNRVKNSGIDFVMIRSSWGLFNKDTRFEEYVNGCERAGIPYGLYHYSYATNLQQAEIEVNNFIELAKRCNTSYPLAIDMEDADGWKRKNGNPSNQMYVDICEYFCKKIEEAGFYAIIYANLDWLNNRLNSPKLDRFDKWVAQWSNKCTYSKPYGMWQYTDNGSVQGINTRVDMNYAYKDYPQIIKGITIKPSDNPQPTPQPVTNETIYTVQKGDTLSSIASRYGTTYQHLAQINGIANPNKIYVGQQIKINRSGNNNQVYVVKSGDTLSGIAKKYGTTYQELARKNGIADPNKIYPGQKIII